MSNLSQIIISALITLGIMVLAISAFIASYLIVPVVIGGFIFAIIFVIVKDEIDKR